MHTPDPDFEARIREEKRLVAIENHAEAWAEGEAAGIDIDIIAETALATALGELARCCGEESALALVDRMRNRILSGEFTRGGCLH